MDNGSDDTIHFDEKGNCNYCTAALNRSGTAYFPNEEGKEKIDLLVARLKKEGGTKRYDCIMGLSGGLDSSYLAYLGYTWGLRVLAVHVDDGFDTEIARNNLKKLVSATRMELMIEKPDKEQFHGLMKAYIMAGVPNIAISQDNIVAACMYRYARRYKIKTFLSGGNIALESILQQGNTYRSFDVTNIKAINKAHGAGPINKLPLITDYRRFIDQKLLRIETVRPLNYIDYNRERALSDLSKFCGFEYYGGKHLENTLTKFIQVYWFYNKFHVDKRRSHLSSMIVSGQMTREQALTILQQPLYDEKEMQHEIQSVCGSLHISKEEFDKAMSAPNRKHTDYRIDKIYPHVKKYFF